MEMVGSPMALLLLTLSAGARARMDFTIACPCSWTTFYNLMGKRFMAVCSDGATLCPSKDPGVATFYGFVGVRVTFC